MSIAPHAGVANLRPFTGGPDPRRNVSGPLSKAEKEFRRLIEEEQIPRANDLLTSCFDAGMAGDMKAAELFFKVCGLIRKPTDNAAIQEQARALLEAMMAEARERRSGG